MNKYSYVLFDLDGTLTDSGPGIMNASRRALAHFGIDETDEKKLRLFVGPPLDKSFIERYGFSEKEAWEAIGKFREYYNVTGIFENSVYPGIPELLSGLRARGIVTAIASSKPQVLIHRVLEHFDLEKYFDVIVGCELDGTRSTKSEVVKEVLLQLADIAAGRNMATPSEGASGADHNSIIEKCVMVGDRSYDAEGSHAFGIPCIGVLYGYGTREEIEASGADYIAETVEDIAKFI